MALPMTPDQMLKALEDEGLTVREYPGWRTRCRCCPDNVAHRPKGPFTARAWGDVNGTVTHITAGDLGKRTVEQYIRDIINGDKATPLKAQVVTAPNGDVWVNSAGRCNHAGGVGSKVKAHLKAADFSLTDDYDDRFRGSSADGNAFTYGNEVITSKTMTAAAHRSAILVAAAFARFHKWTGQESVGHGEISSARYKVDPGLHMGDFRKAVMARVKAGTGTAPKPPVVTPPTPPKPPVVTPPKPVATTEQLRLLGWNLKAPELTRSGPYAWVKRRLGIVAEVKSLRPDVAAFVETGSGSYLTWWRAAFKPLGLTWAKGGGKWRNIFFGKRVKFLYGGMYSPPKSRLLNGDTKQMAWAVGGFFTERILVGAGHTENENGNDKASGRTGEQQRQLQVDSYLNYLERLATKYDVDPVNVYLYIDGNSPTGGVEKSVVKSTNMRDAFDLADTTTGKDLKSNNKWHQSTKGIQIDLVLVDENADVEHASNKDTHELTDHNRIFVKIRVAVRRLVK